MSGAMRLSRHDVTLYASCLVFALDSIANYYFSIPVFVASTPLLTILALSCVRDRQRLLLTLIAIVLLISTFLINSARFGLSQDNVSDALFLILTFAYISAASSGSASRSAISTVTILFGLLFIPAFLGINNNFGNDDALSSGSTDIEYLRAYRQGLYRLPHLAAYLLSFGAMWWFMRWEADKKRITYAVVSAGFLLTCLYTGSRTPVFIFVIGFLLSFMELSIKKVAMLLIAICVLALAVTKIDDILQLTEGTFFYQYPSAVKTALTNFERLSRFMIWSSWYEAMGSFRLEDYAFGRSFAQSLEYNRIHLGNAIWFHNDFLSIIYSYGVPVFLIYAWMLIGATRKLAKGSFTRGSTMLVTFILGSGFINGFYKYLPVVFLLTLSYWHFIDKRPDGRD